MHLFPGFSVNAFKGFKFWNDYVGFRLVKPSPGQKLKIAASSNVFENHYAIYDSCRNINEIGPTIKHVSRLLMYKCVGLHALSFLYTCISVFKFKMPNL